MSSSFEITGDLREDRERREASHWVDMGSSIVALFTPSFDEVVVGCSSKEAGSSGRSPWKMIPCGHIEQIDVPSTNNPHLRETLAAENCAERELVGETGFQVNDLVDRVIQMEYVREFTKRESSGVKYLKQFHFFGLLKERKPLPEHIPEETEMIIREYWPVILAIEGGPKGKKFNPFHRLALLSCIQELIDKKLHEVPEFSGFRKLRTALYEREIGNIENGELNLVSYMQKLHGMIACGNI